MLPSLSTCCCQTQPSRRGIDPIHPSLHQEPSAIAEAAARTGAADRCGSTAGLYSESLIHPRHRRRHYHLSIISIISIIISIISISISISISSIIIRSLVSSIVSRAGPSRF